MKIRTLFLFLSMFALRGLALAQGLDPAVQAKIDAQVATITAWAADPVILQAVKAHNASVPADQAAMNQEKWKALTVLDPFVRDRVAPPGQAAPRKRLAFKAAGSSPLRYRAAVEGSGPCGFPPSGALSCAVVSQTRNIHADSASSDPTITQWHTQQHTSAW